MLSPRARALARIRTSPVERAREVPRQTVRLSGRVEPDEATLRTVTAWTAGRIERLQARTTGESIRPGQTVAALYSPEVHAAEQDLITAGAQLRRLASASEAARMAARAGRRAAADRLRLLGVSDTEIGRIEDRQQPRPRIPIRSPFGGTVIERLADEGAYVDTGTPLYRLADLTRLWIQLDAYERDLPALEEGQSVAVEIDALPGEPIEGRVAFIEPMVDGRRRTARVRVQVQNPQGSLRPGMFVQASIDTGQEAERSAENTASNASTAHALTIPASAPLFTGRRSIVYVEVPNRAQPTYEARTVTLGPRMGQRYPVVAGLVEGERVVAQGAFALDADLQIRGGRSMLARDDDTVPTADSVDAAWLTSLGPIVEAYLQAQAHLANDELAGGREAGAQLVRALERHASNMPAPSGEGLRWATVRETLADHATSVANADSLQRARTHFEALSTDLVALLRAYGNRLPTPIRLAHCPMAFENRGARWLQTADVIDNVYFGDAMRHCGSFLAEVGPSDRLEETSP